MIVVAVAAIGAQVARLPVTLVFAGAVVLSSALVDLPGKAQFGGSTANAGLTIAYAFFGALIVTQWPRSTPRETARPLRPFLALLILGLFSIGWGEQSIRRDPKRPRSVRLHCVRAVWHRGRCARTGARPVCREGIRSSFDRRPRALRRKRGSWRRRLWGRDRQSIVRAFRASRHCLGRCRMALSREVRTDTHLAQRASHCAEPLPHRICGRARYLLLRLAEPSNKSRMVPIRRRSQCCGRHQLRNRRTGPPASRSRLRRRCPSDRRWSLHQRHWTLRVLGNDVGLVSHLPVHWSWSR